MLAQLDLASFQAQQHYPPGMAQFGGRLGIFVEEHALHRAQLGGILPQHLVQLVGDADQPSRQRVIGGHADDAVRHVTQAVPFGRDDPPTEVDGARINANCDHLAWPTMPRPLDRPKRKATMRGPVIQRSEFTVSQEQSSLRLDQLLAQAVPGLSRTRARQILLSGGVFVDKKRVKVASRTLRAGQRVAVHFEHSATGRDPKRSWEVPIIALGDDYVVVNKPSGLASAPTPNSDQNDVVFHLKQQLRALGHNHDVFVIHRLDQPTSGVMIFARNSSAAARLSLGLADHSIDRQYLALVLTPTDDCARIDAPIEGKPAVTHFTTLERRGAVSLVQARLETGRTHQVRIHAESWGCPIFGDARYGRQAMHAAARAGQRPVGKAPRLALHAHRLQVPALGQSEAAVFECALAEDLQHFWDAQNRSAPH